MSRRFVWPSSGHATYAVQSRCRPPRRPPYCARRRSCRTCRRRGQHTAGIQIYGWLGQPDWERAARRLDALGLDAMNILCRAHRDADKHAAAMAVYSERLTEDRLDRRANEGLPPAAAGTGDPTQLADAWQQVCACLEGDVDAELRELYDRLGLYLGRVSDRGAKA